MFTDSATLALMAALGASLALAWRRPDHRGFALALLLLAAANALGLRLDARFHLSDRPLDAAPLAGAARAAHHVDSALEIGGSAILAALGGYYFADWRRRGLLLLAGAWLGASLYLAAVYPSVRGGDLRRFFLAAELAALFAVFASLVVAWWSRPAMTPAHLCTLLLAFGAAATTLGGAQQAGYFGAPYALVQVALAFLYTVLTLCQIGAFLWTSIRSPS